MDNKLNKDSIMECPVHGLKKPTFICKHLQYGRGLGFHQTDGINTELPFKNAWCDRCNEVYEQEGEWNDRSERFADILAVCEGCFGVIKERNKGIKN